MVEAAAAAIMDGIWTDPKDAAKAAIRAAMKAAGE